MSVPAPQRFNFKIDPKTPVKELLPPAPKAVPEPVTPPADDPAQVPEVQFQQPLPRGLDTHKAMSETAHVIAKINHLNKEKSDRFMEELLAHRPDLAGLPVAMGEACRTKGERSKQFAVAVAQVRQALQASHVMSTRIVNQTRGDGSVVQMPVQEVRTVAGDGPNSFWARYRQVCANEDVNSPRNETSDEGVVAAARVAALMQVLAPESASLRKGLARYLAGVSHVDATRALARLAIFSAEDEVRSAAVDALKLRRERDYTDLLLQGLRYPLPAVARRASEAIVKLERHDLIPQLVDLLDEPDPRAPVVREVNEKRVPVVRELVRINHHRNCLLCHAPGNTGAVSVNAVTAAVPVPTEPLPLPSQGYQQSSPDLFVRVDVTYLRQDFSMLLPVADANPWPEMQRFDFLVRNRVLTDEAAKALTKTLASREPGVLSPYHRAALAALRELTGRDTAPTPEGWRRLLRLPARERRLETALREDAVASAR
jgi:hypothetical protein